MILARTAPPYIKKKHSTQRIMLYLLAATLPAIIVLTILYGFGTLINLMLCSIYALILEAIILKIRKKPILFFLQDGSALVTAVLLALALPTYAPWWLTLVSVMSAMLLGKHLYGGLGQNPFNPAMIGYVIVLISFPVEMTQWPSNSLFFTPLHSLQYIMQWTHLPDGWSQATALDVLKINKSLTSSELWAKSPAFGHIGGVGSELVNIAFLLGGVFLLYKRIISWHAPLGMLLALIIMSILFWNNASANTHGSPLFHLFTGATMFGAFFIITDPVSGATSNKGRFIFGLGVGIITYVIRAWGNYPDGLAFSVLLMNLAAPTIDHYTRPRTFGHSRSIKREE